MATRHVILRGSEEIETTLGGDAYVFYYSVDFHAVPLIFSVPLQWSDFS